MPYNEKLITRQGPVQPRDMHLPQPRDTSRDPLPPKIPSKEFSARPGGRMQQIAWALYADRRIPSAVLARRMGIGYRTVAHVRKRLGIPPARIHSHRDKTAAVETYLRIGGLTDSYIARLVGCCRQHVGRTRRRMVNAGLRLKTGTVNS
jgi:hypothetical protein